jgi:hypothetical protein
MNDLRSAIRQLLKNPGFAVATVLTIEHRVIARRREVS